MKIIKHSGIVAAAATVAILGFTSGCQQNSAAWAQFAQSTVDEYYSMNPNLAVDAGLHQYDGMVPDMSQEAIGQRSACLTAKRATAPVRGFRALVVTWCRVSCATAPVMSVVAPVR